MTRPTAAAIAWALDTVYRRIKERAAEFDAESPAGTARGSEEVMHSAADSPRSESESGPVARGEEGKTSPFPVRDEICDCGYVRGSFGCDDAHKNTQKVTTSPERVQIPAESKHVQCPKCPAHMPAGLHCGGAQCPLRKP